MKTQDTSLDAYDKIKPQLTELQALVLRVAQSLGSFTDAELSMEFPGKAYSTVRTRRGELVKAGRIRKTDARRNKSAVWEVVIGGEIQEDLF